MTNGSNDEISDLRLYLQLVRNRRQAAQLELFPLPEAPTSKRPASLEYVGAARVCGCPNCQRYMAGKPSAA